MNSVMAERGDLRTRRQAETRERIVQVVLDLLVDADRATIAMPAVAEAAGVSLRTLYRYFPTKAALLDAAGAWFDGDRWAAAVGRSGVEQIRPDDLAAYQRSRFGDFDTNRAAILAQVTTPAGRALRRRRLDDQRPQVEAALRRRWPMPELSEADRRRVVDAIIAATSSAMYLELVDRLGHAADDAADLTTWLVEALLVHAASTGSTRPSGLGAQPNRAAQEARR